MKSNIRSLITAAILIFINQTLAFPFIFSGIFRFSFFQTVRRFFFPLPVRVCLRFKVLGDGVIAGSDVRIVAFVHTTIRYAEKLL